MSKETSLWKKRTVPYLSGERFPQLLFWPLPQSTCSSGRPNTPNASLSFSSFSSIKETGIPDLLKPGFIQQGNAEWINLRSERNLGQKGYQLPQPWQQQEKQTLGLVTFFPKPTSKLAGRAISGHLACQNKLMWSIMLRIIRKHSHGRAQPLGTGDVGPGPALSAS